MRRLQKVIQGEATPNSSILDHTRSTLRFELYVQDMLSVMQKFCLVNVVEQAKVLDGLSEYQRRILCKIEKVISCWDDGYANISVSSVNSEDLLNSS